MTERRPDHAKMVRASKLLAEVFEYIDKFVRIGITPVQIDNLVRNYIFKELKARPASLKYHGFPKSSCISVNEVACHGIPDNTPFKNGDIVSIDITLKKDGHFSDACRTYIIGMGTEKTYTLCKAAKKATMNTIKAVKAGVTPAELGRISEETAKKYGMNVITRAGGHGIGRELHLSPFIPAYDRKIDNVPLEAGQYITIEPILTTGYGLITMEKDGWTMVTQDSEPCAQVEHTIMVTEDGYKILV